jgi:diacylglycerol kinase (ATP)
MKTFIQGRIKSFRPAFAGMAHVLHTQPNAWLHAIISIAVIAVGLWLGLPAGSWATIVVMMAVVWAAEFFNTAIEAVVDLASPQIHPLAKIAKDVSAGAVVICAAAAVIVGLLVLGPPLWERLF